MKRLILAVVTAALLMLSVASVALANPPTPACNGIVVAHGQIHGTGTQGELSLHDLRDANHCTH